MTWSRFIAWLAGLPCRIRGHRWIAIARNKYIAPADVMCARCCPDCGCGRTVNFVYRGVYGAGGIFLITGKACKHAPVDHRGLPEEMTLQALAGERCD